MLMLSVQGRVRAACEDDSERLAQVFRLSWLHAYRAIIPAQDLDFLLGKRRGSWWKRALHSNRKIVVVETGDVVAGYAIFGPARGSITLGGEIFELYLSPEHLGHGLGELLFEGCRARMDTQGLDGLIVWALSENDKAIEFYCRRGGRVCDRRWERVGKMALLKLALCWD